MKIALPALALLLTALPLRARAADGIAPEGAWSSDGAAAAPAAGGFEAPPEERTEAPKDDDGQFNALKELMAKMSPIERVKAGIWFLVIQPKTTHKDEIAGMVDQQAGSLAAGEKADYQDYMSVRKTLGGASAAARISKWQEYAKAKPSSAFAELAKREVQHLQSLEQDKRNEKKAGHGRFLAKVGIMVVVLALIGAIVFGAAK